MDVNEAIDCLTKVIKLVEAADYNQEGVSAKKKQQRLLHSLKDCIFDLHQLAIEEGKRVNPPFPPLPYP